jgi:hypothetical protein
MYAIQHTLVSDELFQRKFVCDLQACKGACCVEGDGGAPLSNKEAMVLEEIYEEVKPFMNQNGIQAVEDQGTSITDAEGELSTPLVNNRECAYVVFEADGLASCAIEKAWKAGQVEFQKPVSCHLYPVRITEYEGFDAVNYHEWSICKPACSCGAKLDVPVYRFLKDSLVRKYGLEWFEELDAIYQQLHQA